MKKVTLCFFAVAVCVLCAGGAFAAGVTINKAPSVAPSQAQDAKASTASMLGTVMGLAGNAMALKAQQNQLTAECMPSGAEVSFVDKMIREWARTGRGSVESVESSLGYGKCTTSKGFENAMRLASTSNQDKCFNWIDDKNDLIAYEFPQVGVAELCPDPMDLSCDAKSKKKVSNIYEIYGLIDFGDEDYLPDEATVRASLAAKMDKCAPAKIKAAQRELWGGFLNQTVGGLGQKSNTENIMGQVTGLVQSQSAAPSGLGGALQSFGGMATNFMGTK